MLLRSGWTLSRTIALQAMAMATLMPPGSAHTGSGAALSEYAGTPYHDSRYSAGAQSIPGRVQCAYYDLGGEGVAYHDSTPSNQGSGALNPADGTYLNEFRMHEAVDTSYTKFHDAIDNNPYNKVTPEENQLYVGWTEAGEWFRITVDVAATGTYSADLLYTSNRGGTIAVEAFPGNSAATSTQAAITILATSDPAEPIPWRQWHHWNLMKDAVKLPLEKGRNVLTIRILTEGNMNLAYLNFKPA